MPSGERYRLTLDSKKIDLSPIQYFMLKQKSINPASKDHNFLQRVEGLRTQGLVTKRAGRFVKTKLGLAALAELAMRHKNGNGK